MFLTPSRRDRNKFMGGKTVYVKDRLLVKWLNNFETNISETISLERIISNKKWFMFLCRSPIEIDKLTFLMKFPTHTVKQ